MRTVEQVRERIAEFEVRVKECDEPNSQDGQSDLGMLAGFKRALNLIEEGKTNQDIFKFAQDAVKSYVPYGDDGEDAWQGGFTTALEWAAERYDWDEEGNATFREDIWGEPPHGWY